MVRCADCGFLAVKNLTTRALEEVEEGFRKRGVIPLSEVRPSYGRHEDLPLCFVGRHEDLPLCFVGRHDLQWEIKSTGKQDKTVVITVINDERQCGEAFTEWKLGFTPKEHREMLDRAEWLKWQERQRRDDKRWRVIELIVIGVITVIIAGGFTILGAFIERGSLFP